MKKLLLLSFLITTFSYSQITDENGTTATGQSNVQLTGNIAIGTTSPAEAKLQVVGGNAMVGTLAAQKTVVKQGEIDIYNDNKKKL